MQFLITCEALDHTPYVAECCSNCHVTQLVQVERPSRPLRTRWTNYAYPPLTTVRLCLRVCCARLAMLKRRDALIEVSTYFDPNNRAVITLHVRREVLAKIARMIRHTTPYHRGVGGV